MNYKLQFHPKDKEAAKFEISRNEKRFSDLTEDEKKEALDFIDTAEKVFILWKQQILKSITSHL